MRWFEIIEMEHELQNPTSADKIRLLGESLGLDSTSHVLDMGSGRAGPAILLATEFGCRVTAVERSESFVAAARRRVNEAGVEGLVSLVHSDGKDFPPTTDKYDGALCLGVSFIWERLERAVEALSSAVRSGGSVDTGIQATTLALACSTDLRAGAGSWTVRSSRGAARGPRPSSLCPTATVGPRWPCWS